LFFFLPLFHLENRVYLSRDVQVAGAAWCVAMRIVAGIGDLVQRIEDSRTGHVLGGWAVERSGGAMCGLHLAHGGVWVSWLSLKTKVDGLRVVWPQNHLDSFRWFGLKTSGDSFLQFGLKTGGDGLSRFDFKTGGGFHG
jgi:hypothetical protein